jgi:Protein of unknown function (DUF2585).
MAFVTTIAVIVLNIEGRRWWCPAGDLSPWSWDIWSQHNSQHLVDPYSFTHVLHGVAEFWIWVCCFRECVWCGDYFFRLRSRLVGK